MNIEEGNSVKSVESQTQTLTPVRCSAWLGDSTSELSLITSLRKLHISASVGLAHLHSFAEQLLQHRQHLEVCPLTICSFLLGHPTSEKLQLQENQRP